MQNSILNNLNSVLKIKIEGRNLERFIQRIIKNKIEIIELKYLNYKEAYIKIFAKDYKKIKEIKTIYNISIIDSYGIIKLKKIVKVNSFFIITLIVGFIGLIILTNMIFSIDVIHNKNEIRNLILNELNFNGIKVFSFRKKYSSLEQIKERILNKYKDKIEWLEIERVGTKYIVRLELRQIKEKISTKENRHVVAKKSAIIKKIEAKNGEIIKNINEYVSKGDIIISGEIKLNNEIKGIVPSEGVVYGEVWYKVKTEFPLLYKEEKITNKKNNVYVVKIFNKPFEIFNFEKFNNKKIKEKIIFKSIYIPFLITKQEQTKLIKIEQIYTEEEAINQAGLLALKKMESQLNDNEYVISQKNLKVSIKDSKIVLDTFFTVYEDITDYVKIIEE